jgi:iron complex transport system ATP-binding protein
VVTLSIEGLGFSYGRTAILSTIDIPSVPAGVITALVGPNAAGKTTLLKCLAGLLRFDGRVMLDGKDLRRMKRNEVTRRVGYLPQEVAVHAVLTAFEAVLLAKQHSFSWHAGEADLALVERTLRDLDIDDLAMRYLNELSGGQRQMVSIAQALIRRPEVLLLDEPTSNLDLQRQLEVLELVRQVTVERGLTTVITMHDLNLAARFAENFVVLQNGRIYDAGVPSAVLTTAMVRDVYGVHASISPDAGGVLQVNAIASLRRIEAQGVYQPI